MSKPKQMQAKPPPGTAGGPSARGSGASHPGSAILPALITLAGAVLVALIGGYFSITQAQIPIHATQTAEAQLPLFNTQTAIVRMNTEIPPMLTEAAATVFAQTPGTPTLPAGTPPMAGGGLDWTQLLTFNVNISCPGPELVLDTSDQIPDQPDAQPLVPLALKAYQAYQQKRYADIAFTPLDSMSITNITPNQYIQMSNAFVVDISAHPAPKHADIVYYEVACGGPGPRGPREGSVPLTNQYLTYKQSLHYPEADFYQLAPGEGEYFHLGYQCQTPGTYDVVLNVPFTYLGQPGTAQLATRIICPEERYTGWTYATQSGDWAPWPVPLDHTESLFTGLKYNQTRTWDEKESTYLSGH